MKPDIALNVFVGVATVVADVVAFVVAAVIATVIAAVIAASVVVVTVAASQWSCKQCKNVFADVTGGLNFNLVVVATVMRIVTAATVALTANTAAAVTVD